MSFEFYLARRYLLYQGRGAWGWLISLIGTGSIALGVAALIVTMALMTGFQRDIREKLLGIHPHILISAFSGKMDPVDPRFMAPVKNEKDVSGWAPFVSGQVLVGLGKNSSGGSLKGILPAKEQGVSKISGILAEGSWADLVPPSALEKGEKPKIIVGQELARTIGARVGDVIWLVTPASLGLSAFSVPQAHLFEVVGLAHTGLFDYDSVLVFTHLESGQALFNMKNQVSGFGLRTRSGDKAEAVAARLQKAIEGPFWVRSWLALNKNLFSALKLERTVMFIVIGLLTLVASFMVVTNLLLNITQKIREIGIIQAMGGTGRTIQKIFLFQGMAMGVIGTGVGLILGVGVSVFLSKTDLISLPGDVYYIDHLPIRLVPADILAVVLLAISVVFLATLFPARKASKLDPLDAIRYG